MKSLAALVLAGALCSCAPTGQNLRQFASGDLANAAALAGTHDPTGAECWAALGLAAAPMATPSADGLAVFAERKRLAEAALEEGPCAAVIAPVLLQTIAKAVPAPINFALPF